MLLEDDESDVDSCYGIFSSFLYCNDTMNDEKGYNFEYKDNQCLLRRQEAEIPAIIINFEAILLLNLSQN